MIIHTSVYEGDKQRRASVSKIHCENSEVCDFFKRGECLLISFIPSSCPAGGRRSRVDGYTKKARKHWKFVADAREAAGDTLNKLKYATKVVSKIGDFYYFPYSHINFDSKLKWVMPSHFFSSGIPAVKENDLTDEFLTGILTHRPQALMGGEITSYQKEEVPKLVGHLKIYFPELYERAIKIRPDLKEKAENPVGKTIRLNTAKAGASFTIKEVEYLWNGKALVSDSLKSKPWFWNNVTACRIEIEVNDEFTVVVERGDQVDENTVFLS